MKVGVIGAGTMGQGIAKAFAQVEGYEVALCDIKQEWADGGKEKIAKGYARLVEKGKMTQETVDGILAKIYVLYLPENESLLGYNLQRKTREAFCTSRVYLLIQKE